MFSPKDTQCLMILQAASTSAFGLVLKTLNPTKARQALYRVRKDFGDPGMKELQVRVSPDNSEGEIWLLKLSAANASTVVLTGGFDA